MINFNLKLVEQGLFCDQDEKLVFSLNYLNCLDAKIYLYIKNFFPDQDNILVPFIQDIGFTLIKDESDRIADFGSAYYMNIKYNNSFASRKEVFNINREVFSSSSEAINFIEEKISQKDLIIISTYTKRLTCHENFISHYCPFEGHENEFRHYILIVGSDEKNLYFIDNPIVYNSNRYTYYKNYKEIGSIKKEEIIFAFDAFCETFSLDIDMKQIEELFSANLLYQRLCENHFSKPKKINGLKIINGKSAYEELMQLLEYNATNNSNLMKLVANENSFVDYFSWQIYDLIALRNLTLQVITEHQSLEIIEQFEKLKIFMNYQIIFLKKIQEIVNNKENIGHIPNELLVIFNKIIELDDKIFLQNGLEN